MDAMDKELHKAKTDIRGGSAATPAAAKAGFSVVDEEADGGTLDADLDAELASLLKRDDTDDMGGPEQFNLLKNLLQSFDSQQGMAGPVSNLAGRLAPDVQLPRDK